MSRDLHDRALVIDGLSYHSDGYTGDLREGGVDALNVTVCHFEADFTEAFEQIAGWLAHFAAPDAGWMQIRQASDFQAARYGGKIGLIMGWQNMRPVAGDLDRLYLFHRLGVRIIQPTYNYRNSMGDGNLESENAGLSQLGRDAVRLMNQLSIAIDISHVGDQTARDILALSTQPVLATHVDARAQIARNRSLWLGISDYGDCFGHDIPARYIEAANNHGKSPNVTAALLARGWAAGSRGSLLGRKFCPCAGPNLGFLTLVFRPRARLHGPPHQRPADDFLSQFGGLDQGIQVDAGFDA